MRSSKRGFQLDTGGRWNGIVSALAKYEEVLGMVMDGVLRVLGVVCSVEL